MKHLKMFSLVVLSATALMAWMGVGSASATTLDCEGAACAENTVIHAEAESTVTLHPPIGDIECKESTTEGKLEQVGSSTTTAGGKISTLTFGSCNAKVTVLKPGSLEIHTQEANSNNNGTLTSTGSEVTVEFLGFHCIFGTNNTTIGTVTGSATTGGSATLDIAATIPRTGGRSGAFCGSTAQWTGSYKADKPTSLNVT